MKNNCDFSEKLIALIHSGNDIEAINQCKEELHISSLQECYKHIAWVFYEKNDYKEACRWFHLIDIQNDDELKCGLSWSHYGLGVTYFNQNDPRNAKIEFEKSLDLGFYRPYYWLGVMYKSGYGVDKDLKKAKEYYHKAVQCGYLIAERALLQIEYTKSKGLKKIIVIVKVLKLLTKAIKIGIKDINDERLADIPNIFSKL